jgi:hypothetical protein
VMCVNQFSLRFLEFCAVAKLIGPGLQGHKFV